MPEPAERPGTPAPTPETAAARRRRLDAVFGDVLPDTTRDERDDDARRGGGQEDPGEAWLRAQVPPHHGG